ncbi:hypothetical protein [Verrucosispora sp. WMMD1129]|uniref:hypothetical protein n=1 Tax=Verrucosispora sp. WMMD1129 TaxID=3016093 RepID=UPI00249C1B2F|nr:hypothetical protein [Verrucosispora sp. WMMD1129]WFE44275.1 hypothetical protein O7624_07965 [Verrucosispora sp. WMMD1129]
MTQPLPPACCREANEPDGCPQHRQQRRELRHTGIRVRSGGGHQVVGESGKAAEASGRPDGGAAT